MTTQDGYDWPNGCSDERWPAPAQQPIGQRMDEAWAPTRTLMEADRRAPFRRLVPYDAAAHAAAYPFL